MRGKADKSFFERKRAKQADRRRLHADKYAQQAKSDKEGTDEQPR